jgi:multidrug resistance protein MdtO
MATAVQTAPAWAGRVSWLRDFLREELSPYPGRGVLVARVVLATTIVMVLTMTFQIPFGAVAAFFTMLISRESPEATVKASKLMAVSFVAGAADVLLGAVFFSGEPLLRLGWVIFSFFLMFYLLSAMSNYAAALQFGVLIALTIPVWDQFVPTEVKVENTLWAVGAVLMGTVVTTVLELIYARLQPNDAINVSLSRRLTATAVLLRSWAEGIQNPRAEQAIVRLGMLGTSRMRRDLQRANYAPAYAQHMGGLVVLVGRLVDLAASAPQVASYTVAIPEPAQRQRLLHLAAMVEVFADRLLGRKTPLPAAVPEGGSSVIGTALLTEMEGATDLIAGIICGGETPGYLALAATPSEQAGAGFFVSDAFSSPRHLRFAVRGGLAALACYLLYNLVAWPALSTSLLTCFVTALTTVGASRQKQVLRFAGFFVGGFIFGFGAQIFILPGIDSITGFLLLFVAVTIIAAWIATSGPRLSYFGLQIALTFYFINLGDFKFQTSLSVARDRVVGVLLGLVMMWLIFDQLWGASAVTAMQRSFVSGVRLLAQLMREPVSANLQQATDRTFTLRETLHTTFETLRQQADGVALEFGPAREHNMALRTRTLAWSLKLRIVFLARATLLRYRMNLPGFELPPEKLQAQKDFDNGVAEVLDAIADRLEGQPPKPDVPDPHALFAQLESVLRQASPGEAQSDVERHKQTFVPLTQRVVGSLATLREEVESGAEARA